MRDEMGNDDKVLCVAATDPRVAHLRDTEDVSEFDRLEIHHFFEVYKARTPIQLLWAGKVHRGSERRYRPGGQCAGR